MKYDTKINTITNMGNKNCSNNDNFIGTTELKNVGNNEKDGDKRTEKECNKTRKLFVDLNNPQCPVSQPQKFPDNSKKTSKYNALTFFPLALIRQFKTYLNWFFLFIAVITAIPSITPINSPMSNILPLCIVLAIGLIKEAIEECKRRTSDSKDNNQVVYVYKEGRFMEDKCKNVKIGNIILVL